MRITTTAAWLMALPIVMIGELAVAGEPESIRAPAAEAPPITAPPDAATSDEALLQQTLLSDSELSANRGGQTLVMSDQALQSLVSGNVVDGDYRAGDINISENALSQFTGLGNFVINTGAQASLQAGMNVTVNVSGDQP